VSRASRPPGPLDKALEQLRWHGLVYRGTDDLKLYEAVCPACRAPEYGLQIREAFRGAEISLKCRGGCSELEIAGALARQPVDERIAEAEQGRDIALAAADQARNLAERAIDLAAK
jgi:hypothetical protein